jgi:phosphatidylglycerophosphatase A
LARLARAIATAGFVGFVPFAPGTAGSAVGLLVYAAVRAIDSAAVEAATIGVVFVTGVWAANVVERQLGKDPGPVVIDEVLGMLVTLAFLDVTMPGAAAGFLIFRVLDVIKPYPAGRFEQVPGGAGIMLDDVMAGVYGNLVLRLLIGAWPVA